MFVSHEIGNFRSCFNVSVLLQSLSFFFVLVIIFRFLLMLICFSHLFICACSIVVTFFLFIHIFCSFVRLCPDVGLHMIHFHFSLCLKNGFSVFQIIKYFHLGRVFKLIYSQFLRHKLCYNSFFRRFEI